MQVSKGKITILVLGCALSIGIANGASAQNYNADNTVQNVRDRSAANPTPLDQSERKADLKLTAKLRRAVVKEPGLSMNARNIKIIDKQGLVILRGPVNSIQEKETINRLAQQFCGTNYRNELDVKLGK